MLRISRELLRHFNGCVVLMVGYIIRRVAPMFVWLLIGLQIIVYQSSSIDRYGACSSCTLHSHITRCTSHRLLVPYIFEWKFFCNLSTTQHDDGTKRRIFSPFSRIFFVWFIRKCVCSNDNKKDWKHILSHRVQRKIEIRFVACSHCAPPLIYWWQKNEMNDWKMLLNEVWRNLHISSN